MIIERQSTRINTHLLGLLIHGSRVRVPDAPPYKSKALREIEGLFYCHFVRVGAILGAISIKVVDEVALKSGVNFHFYGSLIVFHQDSCYLILI